MTKKIVEGVADELWFVDLIIDGFQFAEGSNSVDNTAKWI